jgi:4-hydroxy-tetrahydrodipicolinate synthase
MMTGAVKPNFRLPYIALSKEQRTEGFALLNALSDDERVGQSLSILDDETFKYCI